MYTVLGATGHIGSVITKALLEKGEKVRAVGRRTDQLQQFVLKGAEAFQADVTDTAALTKALTGVRAAFLLIPPNMTSPDYRVDQQRISESITSAVKASGLQYAVNLSSYGAQVATGAGPISGLHFAELNLNSVEKLNVLHLRPAYFMENHLNSIGMIQMMGIYGGAIKPDLPVPMIATHDIGVFAADRLLKLDFNGKQIQELQGQRDLTMTEVATAIANALNNHDLRYVQFPYDQVEQVLAQLGAPPKTAAMTIEMLQGINNGIVAPQQPRSAVNTTPTSIESFIKQVFVPAYLGMAASA